MIKIGDLIFIFLFFVGSLGLAEEVNVQAIVSSDTIGIGQTLPVSVMVTSKDSVDVNEPHVPALDGFNLLTTSTSSSTSSKLIQGPNGMQFETQRTKNFIFVLQPQKVGSLTIPSFEVVVNGKTYNTKPINLKVTNEPAANAAGAAGEEPDEEMDEAEQMFNQLLQSRGLRPPPGVVPPANQGATNGSGANFKNGIQGVPTNPNEAFSVQLSIDKKEAYEGEQILAEWYIYSRGNILSLDRTKFPDLRGFWKEIIEEVPALNFTQEVVNGVPYRKALLASHALFPIKAGEATIDEFTIGAKVQVPTPYGFSQPYTFNRSSQRVVIKVKPLPTEGRPKDFSGAVGEFQVKAMTEGNSFPVNQPFSLKVRFEGSGNAKLIELPALNLPGNLELYNTKTDSKFFKNGKSYKEFDILLIPREEGAVTIPELSFSIFDPAEKQYKSIKTQAIPMTITQSATTAGTGDTGKDFTDKPQVEKKLALPDMITSWDSQSLLSRYKQVFLGLFCLVLFLILLLKGIFDLRNPNKEKTLSAKIGHRFESIDQLAKDKKFRAVGVEATNLFYYVLGVATGGQQDHEMHKLIENAPPSIKTELGERILENFNFFQTLGFAPEEVTRSLAQPEMVEKKISDSKNLLNLIIKKIEV